LLLSGIWDHLVGFLLLYHLCNSFCALNSLCYKYLEGHIIQSAHFVWKELGVHRG
jgi:hypothetical protein